MKLAHSSMLDWMPLFSPLTFFISSNFLLQIGKQNDDNNNNSSNYNDSQLTQMEEVCGCLPSRRGGGSGELLCRAGNGFKITFFLLRHHAIFPLVDCSFFLVG